MKFAKNFEFQFFYRNSAIFLLIVKLMNLLGLKFLSNSKLKFLSHFYYFTIFMFTYFSPEISGTLRAKGWVLKPTLDLTLTNNFFSEENIVCWKYFIWKICHKYAKISATRGKSPRETVDSWFSHLFQFSCIMYSAYLIAIRIWFT